MTSAAPSQPQVETPVPPDIRIFPIGDLFVPDWNPRKTIIPWDLANLVAFMNSGGKPPRITVWKGEDKLSRAEATSQGPGLRSAGSIGEEQASRAEATSQGPGLRSAGSIGEEQASRAEATSQGPGLRSAGSKGEPAQWAIIEGQMRLLAAQQLGWTHMEAEVVDCTLIDAKTRAFTSNNQNKPLWLDTDLGITMLFYELKNQGVTQEALAGRLGRSESKVSRAIKITNALTQVSKDLIYQNLQKTLKNGVAPRKSKNKGFLITENHLLALADLEYPAKVEKALGVVLDDYLTEAQTKNLIKKIKAGNTPVTIDSDKPVKIAVETPKADVGVPKVDSPAQTANSPSELAPLPVDPSDQGLQHAPDPRSQTEGHGLGVPTPKQGMGTGSAQPAPEVTPQNPSAEGSDSTPLINTPEEKDKEDVQQAPPTPPKSGFWNALKQVWQGFAGAGLKAFFASVPNLADSPMESAQSYQAPNVLGTAQPSSPVLKAGDGANHGPQLGVSAQTQAKAIESGDPVSKQTDAPGSKTNPGEVSFFWGTMAGIPWIKAIRAKIKSGQDLTLWEKLFLVAAFFGRILHWTWHKTWPRTKWFFGLVWQYMKIGLNATLRFLGEVVGKPAKKVIQGVVGIVLVLGLAYGLYLFFFHPAGLRGLLSRTASGAIHWVGSWVNPWEGDTHTDSTKESVQSYQAPNGLGTAQPSSPVLRTGNGANPGTQLGASAQTQVSRQALAVPISKPDMGMPVPTAVPTVVPTPEIVKTKHLKLKTSKSLKKAVPAAVVSNQNPTPKTENTAASSALPGAPATGEEAAWVAELIPAFPPPFLVKPLDLQPDPTISPVMVQKRLSEIQDPERFRVYVGHDRQTVKSMNVDDGGMDLFFNGSFGGLLGDSSSFRFFWEDVQGIRLATVEVSGDKPQTLCFCALEVKTKKKMAAFECDPGDVAHLVSALAAQFKSSTKREVSVAPLPYLNQGMWLGGQNQVDGMWWESPAGRSQEVKLRFTPADWQRPTTGGGIRLGDYLWSLGVNQDNQTGKDEFLRQLGGMASGPATLFVVGPEDWRKARNAETGPENDPFNPPRRAVRLAAP